MPRRLSLWRTIWSAIAMALFISLAFWGAALDEVWRLLLLADWRAVLLAGLLFALTTVAKALRWRVFFRQQQIRTRSLVAGIAIGQLINYFIPARLGELGRVAVLRRRERLSGAWLLGTVAAEKLIELLSLLVLVGLVLPTVPLPVWLRESLVRLVISAAVVALLLFLWVRLRLPGPGPMSNVIGSTFGVALVWLERHWRLALGGLLPLSRPALLGTMFLWSAVIWFMMIATNYVLFYALALTPSWLAASVLLVVLQVGISVPSTPAKVGIFQYLAALSLSMFSVDRELALSYGVLLYLVVLVPLVAMAAPFLVQEVVDMRRREPAAKMSKTFEAGPGWREGVQ